MTYGWFYLPNYLVRSALPFVRSVRRNGPRQSLTAFTKVAISAHKKRRQMSALSRHRKTGQHRSDKRRAPIRASSATTAERRPSERRVLWLGETKRGGPGYVQYPGADFFRQFLFLFLMKAPTFLQCFPPGCGTRGRSRLYKEGENVANTRIHSVLAP